jgi:membrane fusion protein, multidrug efflux system
MKSKKNIIALTITTVLVAIIVVRLISNKKSFEEELKMVSETNSAIPVITDTVKYRQIATGFSTDGTFKPYQEITITAEAQGKIVSAGSETGDKVFAGQILASIDNRIAQSQLDLARFNLEKAEKDLKRFELLSQGDAVTIQQYETAKQEFEMAQSAYKLANMENENTSIKAPFDGVITKRYIEKGTFISPGSPVFDIVEIKRLKFITKLTLEEADKVQIGQSVKLEVDAYPEMSCNGKVKVVVIKADLSKKYEVEIELENSYDRLIKPGMFGAVIFKNNNNEQALVIPRNAIAGSLKNPEIFLIKGDSVSLQKIIVTPLNDKYVIANTGLRNGDIVVTSGQISLVNGSKIKLNN